MIYNHAEWYEQLFSLVLRMKMLVLSLTPQLTPSAFFYVRSLRFKIKEAPGSHIRIKQTSKVCTFLLSH